MGKDPRKGRLRSTGGKQFDIDFAVIGRRTREPASRILWSAMR